MHLQNQLIVVVQIWGKYSTSSPATVPEMLASKVTPGLQQEQSPTPISLMSKFVCKGMIKWKETQNNIVSTLKLGQGCMGK